MSVKERFAAVRADLASLEDLCTGQAWQLDQLRGGLQEATAGLRALLKLADRYGWDELDDEALRLTGELFEKAERLEKLAWEQARAS